MTHKKFILLAVIIFIMLSATTSSIIFGSKRSISTEPDMLYLAEERRSETLAQDSSAPIPLYIIATAESRIGIFASDGEQLLESIDFPIILLPCCDRAMLERGISVYSENELRNIIADFTG